MSMKTIGLGITIGAAIQGSFGSAFKTIDEKSKAISNSLKAIGFKKGLSGKVLGLNKELKQLQKAQKRAGGGSKELKAKIKETKKAFLEARVEAKKYGIELENASKMQKSFSKLEDLKTKNGLSLAASSDRKGYRDKAKTQLFDKVAMGVAIATPFKAGIEFESSMARVKALSGATNEEFEKLNTAAKKLGASTTFSASQVGQGMQYLAMAGFKANDTVKAMPGLLNLAAAGQTDLARTSDIASDILSGFGLQAKDMGRVGDVLSKTFTTANVDLAMLGETMKYVAPVARKAGMSLEEASAMAGLLGNIGIKGSQGGTVMRAMLLRLASPAGAASKALESLGVKTLDADGNVRNMIDIMGKFASASKDMGSGEQLDLMKTIFGEEAASGMSELITQEGEKGITKYLDVIKNSTGTAVKIAKMQNNTVAGAFKGLGSAVEGISISMTSLFLPALKGITQGITFVAQALNGFIENHKFAATVIGAVGGGMIALSIAAFGLRYAFSFVADGFGSLLRGFRSVVFWTSAEGRTLAWTKMQLIATAVRTKTLAFWQGVLATKTKAATLWTARSSIVQKGAALASGLFSLAIRGVGFAFKMALGPIGWVIAGVSAVGTAVVWAYNKFDWFKKGVDTVWSWIKTAFSFSIYGLIIEGWGKAFDWLSSKFEWFKNAAEMFKNAASGIAGFFGFGEGENKLEVGKTVKNVAVGEGENKLEVGKTIKNVAVGTAMATSLATAEPSQVIEPMSSPITQGTESPSSGNTYSIAVQVQSGDPEVIAREVQRVIRSMEDSKRNRSFDDEEI